MKDKIKEKLNYLISRNICSLFIERIELLLKEDIKPIILVELDVILQTLIDECEKENIDFSQYYKKDCDKCKTKKELKIQMKGVIKLSYNYMNN